jgi:PIN domain nuclease of toxin-antitoxin system
VGRIELPDDPVEWFTNALQEFDVSVVPIDARIATRSTFIAQNFHGDPADQLIAATAIELNLPVITADERLRKSPAVRTIW